MSLTKVSTAMVKNDPVNVKDFGAVGDGVTDDTDAFEAAIGNTTGIYIPTGTYRLTRTLNTRTLGLGNGRSIVGEGMTSTTLSFDGVSGLFVDNEETRLSSFAVLNSDFVLTGTPATDKTTIAAGIYGIRTTRSHISMEHLRVRGFAYGLYCNGRYYNLHQNIRFLNNLVALYVAETGGITAPAFQTFLQCDLNNSYDSQVYIERGSGWDFYDCTFENCFAEDVDNANYPNGGVYVDSAARANFENCWVEGANIFLDGKCNVSTNQWRKTWLGSPCNINNYFTERKTINLVDPIYTASPSWPDTGGTRTVDKSASNLDDGKRYVEVSDTTGTGTSKNFISAVNTGIRGLLYPANTFGCFVHAGVWVQFKTNDVPLFRLDVEIEDTNGTVYSVDAQARLQPTGKPDLTLVDEWQYVGFFAPTRETFKTDFPLKEVRMRIRYGLSGDDFSGSAREFWLADPTLRFFVEEGHPLVDDI